MLTLDTVSTAYASITTSWDAITDVTWTKLRLVRSATGTPRDERDGDVLFEDDYATARASYTDTGLTTGRYYYYGLFVLTSNGWVARGSATFLVTKDWGYTGKLYNSLPEVFKSSDYTAVTDPIVEPEESFLYRFLSVFGFQLDALRSEAESARHLLDAKLTNQALLPALAAQVGVTYEPEIGTRSLRQLIANAIHLWGIKGTVPGVRELASVLTGYVTHVRIGSNLALDGLDAGPTTDKGRWVGKTNCTVTYQVNAATDVNPAGNGVRRITATAAGATVCDTNPGGTNSLFRRQYAVPVLPGRDYYVSQYLRTAGAATTARMGAQWLDGNGNSLGPVETPVATTAVGAAWGRVSSLVHAPSGARYLEPSLITGALTTGQVVEACGFAVQEGGLNSNLLTSNQSSFETDTTGWQGNGNVSATRSTAQSLNGAASMSLSSLAAGDMGIVTSLGTSGRPVVGGQVYTFVASFRAATAGRAVRVLAYWYDATGALLSYPMGANSVDHTAGWTQASITVQAPANAAYAAISPQVLATGAASEVHYVDAVGIFPNPTGNLVYNPDLENGTTGWFGGSSNSLAWSSADAYTGRASLLVTRTNSFPGNAFAGINVSLIAGKTYTMSARIKREAGSGQVVEALVFGSGGQYITYPNQVSLDDTWKLCTATFVAPVTETATLIWADDGSSSYATGNAFYIDAVQVVVGSTAPTWVPPKTTNLFMNPSFEVDTSYMNPFDGYSSAGRATDQAYVGGASYKQVSNGTGANGVLRFALMQKFPVGSQIAVSAYVRVSAATLVNIQNLWDFQTAGSVVVPANTWTRVVGTFTVGANTNNADVQFQASAANGVSVWIDAIQVEYGSVATPYFDGSSGAGYSWEAPENLLDVPSAGLETGTVAGWTVQGTATISNSTAQAHSGSRSLAVTWASGSTERAVQVVLNNLPDIVDQVLAVSAWVYSTATRTMQIAHSDNVASEQRGPVVTVAANTWTELVHVLKVGNAGSFGAVKVYATDSATSGTFYVDDVQVEPKNHVTAFGVTGAANASPSKREMTWTVEPSTLQDWECARKVSIYFDPQITNYVGNTSGAAPSNYGWSLGVEAAVDATLGPYLTKYTPDPEDPSAIALSSAYFVDYPGDTVPVPPAPEDSLASTEVYYTAAHMAVTPGQVWTALGEAKPPPGDIAGDPARFGRIGIRLYNGSTYLSTVPGPEVQLIRNVWTTLPTLELTVPDGAAYDHIEVAVITEGPCGFRHIALEDTNQHAAFFFDGSSASTTSDFLWTGTPFQSSTMFYDRRSFRTVRLRGLLIDFLPHGSCYDILFAGAPVSSPASISGVNPDPATSLPL